MLVVFKRTLVPGSIRLKIYDNEAAKAVNAGRLPFQVLAAYDEILVKIRSCRDRLGWRTSVARWKWGVCLTQPIR